MGGGLMQLVAYGAQDVYLTGNPNITFFKVVYRRHTNFSMECITQSIDGQSTVTDSKSNSGDVIISRNGDLIYKIYITSETPGIFDGDEIIKDITLEIGGQQIDKHYKEWNQIWHELNTSASKTNELRIMKGCEGVSGRTGISTVQLPLNFWFCRNPGLALPLIALQYHEVVIKINWGERANVSADTEFEDPKCQIWIDYIYLDTDERRRFAKKSHEYLIEQIQKQSADTSKAVTLNFNHPVKEIIWTSTENYGKAQLKLNGHERFAFQNYEYFQLRQPFDYHTSVPHQNHIDSRINRTFGLETIVMENTLQDTTTAAAVAEGMSMIMKGYDGGYLYNTTTIPTASNDGSAEDNNAQIYYEQTSNPKRKDSLGVGNLYLKSSGTWDLSKITVGDIIVLRLADDINAKHAYPNSVGLPNYTSGDAFWVTQDGFADIAPTQGDLFYTIVTAQPEIQSETRIIKIPTTNPKSPEGAILTRIQHGSKSTRVGTIDSDLGAGGYGITGQAGHTDGDITLNAAVGPTGKNYDDDFYNYCFIDTVDPVGHSMIQDYTKSNQQCVLAPKIPGCDESTKYIITKGGGAGGGAADWDDTYANYYGVTRLQRYPEMNVYIMDRHAATSKMTKKINVYSFALRPEEHQPSGTCNFSRIDNAELVTTNALRDDDNIYAVNYNVLRIMSGMGGLAYSN